MAVYGARKGLLTAAIALTSVAPLAFVPLDEPSLGLNLVKVLAKTGSLAGSMLLLWQFLLGYRGAVARVLPDLIWVIELHKALGHIALPVIVLHPVFISVYYTATFAHNVWAFGTDARFDGMVLVGVTALVVTLLVVATSISLRERLGRRQWYHLHLTSYLIMPLVIVHGFALGMTVRTTAFRYAWYGVAVIVAALYLYRVLCRLDLCALPHDVVRARKVARDVTEILMRPLGRRLNVVPGQFGFIRRRLAEGAHPYTISERDKATGEVAITVKAVGETSAALQSIQSGERVSLEGPYGVFGREALLTSRPVVMIAGGIGITAFRLIVEELSEHPKREAWLFFGSRTREDIVYGDELDRLPHVRVVHVLSEDPEWPGEKGFITTDLLKRYVGDDLVRCEYLICGPPIMIRKLESALRAVGVPDAQLHHEEFGY